MLGYAKGEDHVYSLSKAPVGDLDWGRSSSSAAKLCVGGGNHPMTLWVVGIIDSLWLFNGDGNPQNRISIGVVPLTDHAMMVARNLLSTHSRPSTSEFQSCAWSLLLTASFSIGLSLACQCFPVDVCPRLG